jgi:hypothetical protein
VDFKNTKESLWMNTEKLDAFTGRAMEFDSIFVVGGFGRRSSSISLPLLFHIPQLFICHSLTNESIAMFDLVENHVSIQLILEFWNAGKIVVGLCHGAAAMLNVRIRDGGLLVEGKKVTGFSNQEEIDVDREKDMPFHLETALNKASGGHYEKSAKAWDPHVTVDGKLLMGQNPASANPLAKELLKVLTGSA